jgi:hypothetical protein
MSSRTEEQSSRERERERERERALPTMTANIHASQPPPDRMPPEAMSRSLDRDIR